MIGNGEGFHLVVGDEQCRGIGGFEDVAHLVGEALAQFDIEVGERLVEQQELGAGRQGTCQGHALLLAARELVRCALGRLREANAGQGFLHTGRLLGGGQVLQAKGHVLCHVHVREQGVVLKDHANAPALWRHVNFGAAHHLAMQLDIACGEGFQPGHGTQQGGFATSRWANQGTNFARGQAKTQTTHGGLGPARVAHLDITQQQIHGARL